MDGVNKKIKQWAKQMPKLNTAPMALTARLQQASKHITEELNSTFKHYKLSDAGFEVMATLLRAGTPYSLSPGQLLDQMSITSGTLTTRIDKLEKKGLVKRKTKKDDKRGVNVALTKKGLKLIKEVVVEHAQAQESIVSVLDEQEQQTFVVLLQKLLAANRKDLK
ncbi:MarR family winged helix-turn-helix transcriptional regulator [Glaciecola sp. SC05]|uniref:MarR family winged helix-turn-helix transcriptional regulator n=1 Tax=Glaciecola sp. SC05 TaxID=1987355 RepID=UPI003527E1C4